MSTQSRALEIFLELLNQKRIRTDDISNEFNISLRSAQRDIQTVKSTVNDYYARDVVVFDPNDNFYFLDPLERISDKSVFAIIKVLLDSRFLNRQETEKVIDSLLRLLPSDSYKSVKNSILNELTFYTEIYDKSDRVNSLWNFKSYIEAKSTIVFDYLNYRVGDDITEEQFTVRPCTVFFDQHYYYLVGYDLETSRYLNFRIDWISNVRTSKKKFAFDKMPKYEHGLVRPVTNMAYRGQRKKITFEYYGFIENVKDKFPSCKIVEVIDTPKKYPFQPHIVEIDVEYSPGIKAWIMSESNVIKVLEPCDVAADIRDTLKKAYDRY